MDEGGHVAVDPGERLRDKEGDTMPLGEGVGIAAVALGDEAGAEVVAEGVRAGGAPSLAAEVDPPLVLVGAPEGEDVAGGLGRLAPEVGAVAERARGLERVDALGLVEGGDGAGDANDVGDVALEGSRVAKVRPGKMPQVDGKGRIAFGPHGLGPVRPAQWSAQGTVCESSAPASERYARTKRVRHKPWGDHS
jgi:hypothetical protein